MSKARKTPLRLVPASTHDCALHIELEDLQPTVWRRVVVPSSIRLPVLHGVIRTAMGWESGEPHEFVFGGVHYGQPHPIDPMPDDLLDETDVTLQKALGSKNSFEYLYDYSSAWWHKITVNKLNQEGPKLSFPICLGGANACPPTGVHGVGEYEEFLEAIANPKHDRHAEFRYICPDHFDPSDFDLTDVSLQLKEITNL